MASSLCSSSSLKLPALNIIIPPSPQIIPRATITIVLFPQKLSKIAPFLSIRCCGSSMTMVATAKEDNRDLLKLTESGFEEQIKVSSAARELMSGANDDSKQAMRDVDDDSEETMMDAYIESLKASNRAEFYFREAILSEIKNAEQMLNSPEGDELLEEFPYEIIDNYPEKITLKRNLSGENIQIVTCDIELPSKHLRLHVTIDKGQGHTLNFECVLHPSPPVYIRNISLQRSADAEDEACKQSICSRYSLYLDMAFSQYLEVRGINGYLFDFYDEYMMNKDKRACAAGKFMLRKDKRASAEVKHVVSATDNLKRQIELDAQVVEQFGSPNKVRELPEDFPFQIIDNHGSAIITLERKLACENIKVTVFEDERHNKSLAFRIVVMINKKEGPSLRFRCKLDLHGLDIESMEKSDKIIGKAHQWSDLSGWVEGLDMRRYLEIKGIESSLFSFFDEYIKKDMTREFLLLLVDDVPLDMRSNTLKDHLLWLKSIREFLEK